MGGRQCLGEEFGRSRPGVAATLDSRARFSTGRHRDRSAAGLTRTTTLRVMARSGEAGMVGEGGESETQRRRVKRVEREKRRERPNPAGFEIRSHLIKQLTSQGPFLLPLFLFRISRCSCYCNGEVNGYATAWARASIQQLRLSALVSPR